MAMRRPPRTLPGPDALLLQKFFLIIYLGMVVVILALSIATAAALGTRAQGGQLPWPLVQWAVTTPLGTLAVALVGGLAAGPTLPPARPRPPPRVTPPRVTWGPRAAPPPPPPPPPA